MRSRRFSDTPALGDRPPDTPPTLSQSHSRPHRPFPRASQTPSGPGHDRGGAPSMQRGPRARDPAARRARPGGAARSAPREQEKRDDRHPRTATGAGPEAGRAGGSNGGARRRRRRAVRAGAPVGPGGPRPSTFQYCTLWYVCGAPVGPGGLRLRTFLYFASWYVCDRPPVRASCWYGDHSDPVPKICPPAAATTAQARAACLQCNLSNG